MSDTIWVRRKSQAGSANSGDDVDHSLFCKNSEALDKLAQSIGVCKLSHFFDTTDLQYNMAEEDLPETWIAENENWFSPSDALPVLTKIVARLKAGEERASKRSRGPSC